MAKKYTSDELLIKRLDLYRTHSITTFKNKFCGDIIGSGVYRKVYEFLPNNKFIVKVQPAPAFQNQLEYMIWREIKGNYWYNRWFAQVLWMNEKGTILVMRKARPVRNQNHPTYKSMKIPHFFSDIHSGNYGWIGKRFVCFDYGNTPITKGWNLLRMRKLKWS
jgi:hypothetical protein